MTKPNSSMLQDRNSPALATFSCPELCIIIASYLSQSDLHHCLLVHKTLYKNFFPYLWRHITLWEFKTYQFELNNFDKQQKQQQHVIAETDNNSMESGCSRPEQPYIPRQRPTMRVHPLTMGVKSPWAPESDSLDISEKYYPYSPPFSSLLQYGHLVEKLTIVWNEGLYFSDDTKKEVAIEDESPGMKQTRVFIQLMQQCPNVRILDITAIHSDLPYMKSGWEVCGFRMGQEIRARSKRINAMDNALAKVFEAVEHIGQRIQELYLSNICGLENKAFKALLDALAPPRHSSLRVLDISACERIKDDKKYQLLRQFPSLEVVDFRCREYMREMFSASGLQCPLLPHYCFDNSEPTHIDKEPWPCQNTLRVLKVGISEAIMHYTKTVPTKPVDYSITPSFWEKETSSDINSTEWKQLELLTGLKYPECFHWFYDRIAAMTNLQELCIVGTRALDRYDMDETVEMKLTLDEGLGRLEGLKQLEVLDVEYLHHQIGVAELEWMVKHWPRLKEIRGLIYEEDEHIEGGTVWSEGVKWLREVRPDISLSVLPFRWTGQVRLQDLVDDEDL